MSTQATESEPGKHRSYHDRVADTVAEELEKIAERLDELIEFGSDEGYRALEHKLQEARGPLTNAIEAMRQYGTGEKRPVT